MPSWFSHEKRYRGWKQFFQPQRCRSFTMIEMMVVIIVIGILAALALTGYRKVVERTYERQMFDDLKLLGTAMQTYYSRVGSFPPDGEMNDTDELNQTLGLNIKRNNFQYFCQWNGGGNYEECRGSSTIYSWVMQARNDFTADEPWYPHCYGAVACPTCELGGGGACY